MSLLDLLTRHVDCSVVCDRFCSCGVQYPVGHAAHLAEVIVAEFLVVPRSEITGTVWQRPALAWSPLPEENSDG